MRNVKYMQNIKSFKNGEIVVTTISCQSRHPVLNLGNHFQPQEVSEMHLHILAIDTISRDLFSWLLFLPWSNTDVSMVTFIADTHIQ